MLFLTSSLVHFYTSLQPHLFILNMAPQHVMTPYILSAKVQLASNFARGQ